MNEFEIKLDKNLQSLLKERHLRQSSVAKRAGINKSSLHNYVNGMLPQGLTVIAKLAKFFDLSIEELLFDLPQSKQQNSVLSALNTEDGFKLEVTIKKVAHSGEKPKLPSTSPLG